MTSSGIADHLDYSQRQIDTYLSVREISSGLSMDASLAVLHSENDWKGIVPAYATFERKWISVYREVADAMSEVQLKMKEFEFKHWMGFHDDDVRELLELYRERETMDWHTAPEERCTFMREFWDPFDIGKKDAWKKHWKKYHNRRVRKPLQHLKGEFCSTEAGVLDRLANAGDDARAAMESMKILMAGSAGRVLITMQDRFPQNDPRSIFGGAWVTLIFDETSPWPRGGVQGHCGTKDEILALIQACIDYMPELLPDNNISIM